MIARLTPYEVTPDALDQLVDEVVARARANRDWPVRYLDRRAEFFFTNSATGNCLSVVVGDDESVVSAVEPERPATGEPRSYDVRRLEFAGPKESGVVDALFGRVVHCPLDVHDDAPLPPDVWTRAKLALPHGNQVVAIVGSNKRSVEEAVAAFTARAKRVDDYDDTAYHFLRYGDL